MSKYYIEIEHDSGMVGFEVVKIVAILTVDSNLAVLTDADTVRIPFRNAELAAEAFDKLSKAKKAVV